LKSRLLPTECCSALWQPARKTSATNASTGVNQFGDFGLRQVSNLIGFRGERSNIAMHEILSFLCVPGQYKPNTAQLFTINHPARTDLARL
jgi:hypothetical protein